jgi:putative ABC transport system permease protein
MLLKARAATVVAIIALALGIGANTAVFSVVNSVLLKPLPYKNSERLYVGPTSVPDYRDLKESTTVFDQVELYASNLYNLRGNEEFEQIRGAVVTAGLIQMLADPMLGRTFRPEEEKERLVIISYGLWQRKFGGSADVLGQSLDLNDRSHTIVGVMPPDFQFPSADFSLWVPFRSALSDAPGQGENRLLRIFRAVATLKPGVSTDQMETELGALTARLRDDHPETNTGFSFRFQSAYEVLVGDVRLGLIILLGAVGLVLLIACANVANLQLARTTAREREIAVRIAIGASKTRIVRQLLTESLLLSTIGGGLGILLAGWGTDLIPILSAGTIPRVDQIEIDFKVLLFTAGVSLLTGLLFGLAPVTQSLKSSIGSSLKDGGRGSVGAARGRRLRGSLIVAEIAVSLVVLIGAGLLLRSFERLMSRDAGFKSEKLLTFNLPLPLSVDNDRRTLLLTQTMDRLAELPGVEVVGACTGLPPETPQRVTRYDVEGIPSTEENDTRWAWFMATTPGYFRALGTQLIAGRDFDPRDSKTSAPVSIISAGLARRLFSDDDPIGKRIKLINPEQQPVWRTIVGVVGDIRYTGLSDTGEAFAIYTPFGQTPFLWAYGMVRSIGDPMEIAGSVKKAVSSTDPTMMAARVRPMDEVVSRSVARPRFNALLLTGFATLALILSAIGIYGVIAYSVSQRTHELGVRLALGARQSDIIRLVVRQGFALSLAGVAIGVGAAIGLTRVMENLLYGVTPTDPLTFALISVLLTIIALMASFIPARRAAKVDPMVALRCE